mgnify:CR=1 FL=1
MANNCYNSVVMYTQENSKLNLKTLKNIKDKFDRYDETDYFNEFGDLLLNKKFDPKNTKRDAYEYGTRWWEVETTFQDEKLIINGDSAWSPPIELIKQICELYKVSAEMYYEECGNDFMGETNMRWIDGSLVIDEEDYSYREGMYRFDLDNFICNTEEEIADYLYDYIHQHNWDSEDCQFKYEIEDRLFEEQFVEDSTRKLILNIFLDYTDNDYLQIIKHEYKTNINTITDVKQIREYVKNVINKINKKYEKQ